jgi:hypothetical protein
LTHLTRKRKPERTPRRGRARVLGENGHRSRRGLSRSKAAARLACHLALLADRGGHAKQAIQITRKAEFLDAGSLTQAEFDAQKKKILGA